MRLFKRIVLIGIFTIMIIGCGTSKSIQEPNEAIAQLMDQRSFHISVISARPQLTQAMTQVLNGGLMPPGNSLSRIDVNGAGFFIEVQGDSVTARLPYYGERQMGGGYDSDPGINFNNRTEDLKITKDEKKQSFTVQFSVNASAEQFMVTTTIANNASSNTIITSSHRNRIGYSGKVERRSNSE